MACPHVAGAIALLRDVDENLSSTRVKELLYQTAVDLGAAGNDNEFGYGRINCEAAYNALIASRGNVSVGIVTPTRNVRLGQTLWYEVNVTNHTANPQNILLGWEIVITNANVSGFLQGPFPITLAPNFTLDPNWLAQNLPIPANLHPAFLANTYELRIRAFNTSGQQIAVATTPFALLP
jgi:hypothetical protein